MPQATLAECIIALKEQIVSLDAQLQSHSIAKALLELMLRTDALHIPKHELYSLFLCLNEQVVYACQLGENALDLAIKAIRKLSSAMDDGNTSSGGITRH